MINCLSGLATGCLTSQSASRTLPLIVPMPPHLRHQCNGSMLRIPVKMPTEPLYSSITVLAVLERSRSSALAR